MPQLTRYLLFIGLLTAAATGIAAADESRKVYKWLDSHGNLYYGDQFPDDPEATERQILNASGIAVRHLDRNDEAESAALRREVLRSGNRDLALVTSFSSEDELRQTHEESLALLQSSIAISEGNAVRLRKHLQALEVHELQRVISPGGNTTEAGPAESETSAIAKVRQTLADQEDQVRKLRQRHARLEFEYAREMKRYVELTRNEDQPKTR